ncbi:immunity 26/phosphotriesterase HocA family protein [Pseudomonas sp. GD03842]|uniref:Imm26 family immunity protein n=1 Tax=Pseudomonas sp. GD03842 TaxID=2975385 RepID=UPI0024493214|nr:Imm26 family immunity protein [Pseudomonas sp. GD03842]MDH0745190.1 immunity 26/phosphotriesterase HocA family protein [Pseudomonas sp. GD03842]
MTDVKIYGWDLRAKTALRSIKVGDIFCFPVQHGYRFGRIMTRNKLGHVAEIFDKVSDSPNPEQLDFKRVGRPVILDSYGLFDRKMEGDWRIVAHQEGYSPSVDEPTYFTLGVGGSCKKVDIFDNQEPIAESDAKKLPDYSPLGEIDVIEELGL